MADDLFAGGITFIDEQVKLYVEADDFFAPDVFVTFEGVHQGSSASPSAVKFSESLTAEPSVLRDPKNAKGQKATRIPWKVNINKNPNFKDTTVILKFTVSGVSASGVHMLATTQEKIVVGAITVTNDPKLTRIMVHEFSSGKPAAFDPEPLKSHIATLSGEQKRTLFKHAIAKPDGRLVVFITIYSKKDLRMNADYCRAPNRCARPNATFSVFHCFEPLKGGVVLVCHTEHFLLNLQNYLGLTKKDGTPRRDPRDTWIEIHKIKDGKAPNVWLNKNNTRPIQYKIASEIPQRRNDGVIWSRLFSPKGRDVMMGNTIHGMINTVGCWMLFRNYNWPQSISNQLDRIFRNVLRTSRATTPAELKVFKAKLQGELAKVGYDVLKRNGQNSTSLEKFLHFDRNFAYLWFFHEIVGIRYFSDKITWDVLRDVNDRTHRDIHDLPFAKTFNLSQIDALPIFNLPDEGNFAFHDSDDRRAADRSFRPTDALWRDNAMGFRSSQGFIPLGKEASDLDQNLLDKVSWADVYLYREDDVDVNKLSTKNYSEDDPRV